MPRVDAHLHWRQIDCSTLLELGRRWFPNEMKHAPKKRVWLSAFLGSFYHIVSPEMSHTVLQLSPQIPASFQEVCTPEHNPGNGFLPLAGLNLEAGTIQYMLACRTFLAVCCSDRMQILCLDFCIHSVEIRKSKL